MPTCELKCQACNKIFNLFFSIKATTEEKENFPCPQCNGKMFQTFTSSPAIISCEGDGPESSKPLSYWDNAEKVKQEAIKKRVQIEQEKLFYKDPIAVQKEKNRQQNAKKFEDDED